MKRFLTRAALLAVFSLPAFAQGSAQVTEISEGGQGRARWWHSGYTSAPDFDARGAVTTGMPIMGDFSQLNIRSDAVAKGKVRVIADGREVKTKKIVWTGPVDVQTTPVLRTRCWSYGYTVDCISTTKQRTDVTVRYINEVSIFFKPEHFAALASASDIHVEISGKTYALVPDQLSMLRDVLAASR